MRIDACGLLAVLIGLSCTPRPPSFAIRHAEQRGRLAHNGLRFVIMPDATTDLVEVAVRYRTGSADDPAGKAGLAHLVEHLMFDIRPDGESSSLSQDLGNVAVSWNAYTTHESTHFMALGSARSVDSLLQIEAMRMFYGCRTLSDDDLVREREVVRNELRQRSGWTEAQLEPALIAALYPRGHPYAHPVGGDDAEVSALTLADVCGFVERHYAPANAIVIVTGGVEVGATVGLIETWFGRIDPRAVAPRAAVAPIELARTRTTIDLDIDRPIVAVSWALPPTRDVTDDAVRFAIGQRLSEATEQSQRNELGIRGATLDLGGRDAPVVTLLIELDEIDDVDEVLALTWNAVRRPHARGRFAPAETRSRLKTAFVVGLERLDARANVLGNLIQFRPELAFSVARPYVFQELDVVGQLDVAAVANTSRAIVDPDAARIIVFRPTRRHTVTRRASFDFHPVPHDLGRSAVDPEQARHPLELPSRADLLAGATRFELDNGLQVVLLAVEDAPLPIVSAQLSIGGGDAASPEQPLVPRAAARFAVPPTRYAVQLGRAGVRLGCGTTPDHTICSAQTVSIYLREMLQGLESTLRRGTYDENAIERWLRLTGEVLRRPGQIEDEELDHQELAAVFGRDHVYARSGGGHPDALDGFGGDRLYAFRDEHYGAANTTLVVAGAFDSERAESIIRDAFARWPRGRVDPPVPATARTRTTAVFIGVVRASSPQMTLAISYPSPGGIDGRAAARLVLTEMLSATVADLRNVLGATYGVSVRRENRRGPTRYELRTAVDAARAGEALTALRDSVDSLRRGDDFDARFVRARHRVAERLLAESTTSGELAQRLATIARFGLRPTHYQQLLDDVAALSTVEVQALITTELDESAEVVVAMADRDTLTAAFADAGITGFTLVDP